MRENLLEKKTLKVRVKQQSFLSRKVFLLIKLFCAGFSLKSIVAFHVKVAFGVFFFCSASLLFFSLQLIRSFTVADKRKKIIKYQSLNYHYFPSFLSTILSSHFPISPTRPMRYGGLNPKWRVAWDGRSNMASSNGCSRCNKGVEIVEHVVYGYELGRLLGA